MRRPTNNFVTPLWVVPPLDALAMRARISSEASLTAFNEQARQ
jgi:hypothetical protein